MFKEREGLINFAVRKVERSDAESLTKHINNKKIYNNTYDIPHPYTIIDANRWIDETLESGYDKPANFLNFVIEIEGEAAGGIGMKQVEEKTAEIGYWISEDYWGQGIMSEVIPKFVDYAFKTVGMEKLIVEIFDFNKPSQGLIQKCGFKKVGVGVLEKDEKEINTIFYEIRR